MQIIITASTVTKALKKPMSHARRFWFVLIIYLPILLQLRLANRPMTCAHCLFRETHGWEPRFLEPAEPPIATPLLLDTLIIYMCVSAGVHR